MKIWNSAILVFIASCSSVNSDFILEYEFLNSICYLSDSDSEYIIRTEKEYWSMTEELQSYHEFSYNCTDSTKIPLDFENYILLGKYVKRYSEDKLYKKIFFDEKNNRTVYLLELERFQGPKSGTSAFGMNWVKLRLPVASEDVIIEYLEN